MSLRLTILATFWHESWLYEARLRMYAQGRDFLGSLGFPTRETSLATLPAPGCSQTSHSAREHLE